MVTITQDDIVCDSSIRLSILYHDKQDSIDCITAIFVLLDLEITVDRKVVLDQWRWVIPSLPQGTFQIIALLCLRSFCRLLHPRRICFPTNKSKYHTPTYYALQLQK
jgi:hypothetical protein